MMHQSRWDTNLDWKEELELEIHCHTIARDQTIVHGVGVGGVVVEDSYLYLQHSFIEK